MNWDEIKKYLSSGDAGCELKYRNNTVRACHQEGRAMIRTKHDFIPYVSRHYADVDEIAEIMSQLQPDSRKWE